MHLLKQVNMLLFLFILVSAKSFIRKTDLVARFVIMLAQSFFFCMQCLNCPVFPSLGFRRSIPYGWYCLAHVVMVSIFIPHLFDAPYIMIFSYKYSATIPSIFPTGAFDFLQHKNFQVFQCFLFAPSILKRTY